MNTLSSLGHRLHRRALLLVAVAALIVALVPSAAFAANAGETMNIASYGRPYQGRYYNRDNKNYHRQYNFNKHDFSKKHDFNKKRDFSKKDDAKVCRTSYRVKKGDTLTKIAKKHHTTVFSLAKQNGIKNVHRIFAGQRLCIR